MTSLGVVGKKRGMTRVFTEEGIAIPVTVIEVSPNKITQIKTIANDGYQAVQVTTGVKKRSRVAKPLAGHYAKANVVPGEGLWEFRANSLEGLTLGGELDLSQFSEGQLVDVTGISKGKGYTGVIARWNFSSQDATHGNSLTTRAPGSIGQRQSPGKVFKGKKMAGHVGNVQRTVQSQKIVRIDIAKNVILIHGAVPGAPGGDVIIRPAVKHTKAEVK